MTTSIVFDDARMPCETEISFNNDGALDSADTDWLTDPTAPREALQELRILKTRETGELAYIQTFFDPSLETTFLGISFTEGRDRGNNVPFGVNDPIYLDYAMKRKAKVLKTNNKLHESKKSSFSRAVAGSTKYKSLSNARIRALRASQQCTPQPRLKKKSTNSGIYGGKDELWFDPDIPFYSTI
jgi:hypothetical protein